MSALSPKEKYRRYLLSDCWKLKRQYAMECAKFLCQRCFLAPAEDTHHGNGYTNVGNERPGDLICLCRNCHRAVHGLPPVAQPKPANDNQLLLPLQGGSSSQGRSSPPSPPPAKPRESVACAEKLQRWLKES